MLKKKINKQITKTAINSFFWFLAERAFLSFIILCIMVFFAAGTVFYFYAYLPQKSESKIEIEELSIDEEIYQQFISNYSQRKETIYTIGLEDLRDPFYGD